MRIGEPEFRRIGDEIEVSARVEMQTAHLPVPPRLIYRFPVSYADSLSRRGDAFVAALLPLAVYCNEDIQYQGVISARLLHGMDEWIKILSDWMPAWFHPIQVQVGGVVVAAANPNGKVLLPFSGGVDSLYSLYCHLPPQETHPELQVSHVLFAQGFDIPLRMEEEYVGWQQRFERELAPYGVEVIACRTNLQSFSQGILRWEYVFGAALASLGMLLEPMCREFLISSAVTVRDLIPWGSSVALDHWFSTEAMMVCHYGLHHGRLDKLRVIASWHPAEKLLRVCIDPKRRAPGMNCSRCEKCRRTQMMLHLLGRLKRFETFTHPFPLRTMLTWKAQSWQYLREMGGIMMEKHQYSYLPLLVWNMLLYWADSLVRALLPRRWFRQLKQRVYPLEQNLFYTPNLPEEWR